MELTTSASFERVVIVTLGRGNSFSDMDSIKKELSTKVMELGPRRLNHNTQVNGPFRIAYRKIHDAFLYDDQSVFFASVDVFVTQALRIIAN